MNSLKALTEIILSENGNSLTLREGIYAMHNLYAAHTGIKAHDIADADIHLPSGNAISTTQAAHCLLDMTRTACFLRGIHKAILQLKNDFSGEKINIFYAGCGPYATLLTPFTALFTAGELGFYLLDINQHSLDSVSKLYTELGITDYIIGMACDDAAVCRLPEGITMNLVISETMQKALIKEPQVAIMLNLIPQMAPRTIFIPEAITITVKLLSGEEERNRRDVAGYVPGRVDLGSLYKIGRHYCAAHSPVTVQMPLQTQKFRYLSLFTTIKVFDDQQLDPHKCSITLPLEIADVRDLPGRQIEFHYQAGSTPGFRHKWLAAKTVAQHS